MESPAITQTKRTLPLILWAGLADAVLILAFAGQGRATHGESHALTGVLVTAWPFLAAALAGWLLARAWRAPVRLWPAGVLIWLITVLVGLGLRGLAGGGLAFSFQLVALLVLGVLLLGHRLLALTVLRWAARHRMN